ncbi:peptidoglycan recognition protein [Saccharopolyspora taberi]|uniref:Peptidoglycan recognition protein family domain-containing protein n=1 Tax=Saccharopolyspora taberi TaxID=60895 RepID=A0ABN3VPZ4_9PSEU
MRLGSAVALALLLTATAVPATQATSAAQATTASTTVRLADLPARAGEREVRLADPFSMVGLTWSGAPPDQVEISSLTPSGWGRWTALPAERGASEPLWTGRTTSARVRATRAGADVTGELALVALRPDPAPTGALRTDVIKRAEWGADEGLMKWPPEPTTTKAAIVHHTAGTNDYTCEESAAIVRGIYEFHAVTRGWGDMGYHVLVDKCGNRFEGRTGGLGGNVVGAHAMGFNRNTFGIAMLGDFSGVAPPQKMVTAVGEMAGWKLRQAGVPVDGETRLVSEGGENVLFPPGEEATLPTIFAHRDVAHTACPGDHGYTNLAAIRHAAI